MKPTTYAFLIGIFLIPLPSFAQSDSTKAAQLYAIGEKHYSLGNIDSCYYYFEKSKDLFENTSPEGYGYSIYKLGLLDRNKFGYSKAVERFNEAIEIGNQLAEEGNYGLLLYALQEVGYAHMISKEYAASNKILKQLIEVSKKDGTNGMIKATWTYGILIWNYTQTGGFDSAVYYSDLALETAEILRNDTARSYQIVNSISSAYSGVANYYGRIGHYPNFEKYNSMQYDFLESEYGEGHRLLMQPLLGLGNLAFINSNHIEALSYYNKALLIAKAYNDSTSDRYAQLHKKLCEIYSELEEWELALFHSSKALEVYKVKEHLKLDMYHAYAANSRIMSIIGNEAESERYFDLAYEAFENETDEYYLNIIAISLVSSLSERGKIEEATQLSKKALNLGKRLYPARSFELSQNYHALASLAMKSGDNPTAFSYIDSARVANTREDSTTIYTQINIDIHTLEMSLLYRELKKDLLDPEVALVTINAGKNYVGGIKSELESDLGQIYEPNFFYNNAVVLSASIFEKTKDPRFFELAIQLTENDRSFDLKNFIRKADILNTADIPEELVKKRKILLNELVTLKFELSNSDQLESHEENELRKSYDKTKAEYDQLIASLEQKAPTYYQYNYQMNAFPMERLETKLKTSNSMLISYYVTDSILFAFGMDGDERFIEFKQWTDQLTTDITAFRKSLIDPENTEYATLSKKLFESLIGDRLITEGKNLVILPHDILNYIPFELLIFDDTDSFLLEKYLTHYQYSVETYLKNTKKKGAQILAMSPQFRSENESKDVVRSALASLPGAAKEVEEVSRIMSAKTITGFDATESAFKGLARNYGVLHMATHAIVDDENPDNTRLIFSLENDSTNDGYLHNHEIYNLNLNADLVTLSACNTGFGKIKKGEGVMSLSRAFAYAGVPATVVSLWPASDKSTPDLMKFFYQNLKEGQSKDVALNNARKQYLATAERKARHPFYWGGFVMIGDNSPIGNDWGWFWWALPVVLVVLMVIIFYRKKFRISTSLG